MNYIIMKIVSGKQLLNKFETLFLQLIYIWLTLGKHQWRDEKKSGQKEGCSPYLFHVYFICLHTIVWFHWYTTCTLQGLGMLQLTAVQKQSQTAVRKVGTYRQTQDSACLIESVCLRWDAWGCISTSKEFNVPQKPCWIPLSSLTASFSLSFKHRAAGGDGR